MSIPVLITIGEPDPEVDPKTYSDSIAGLRPLIEGSIEETISTYVLGQTVPAVDDQDKPWFRLNTNGAPVGWYSFYLGVWTREEPPISARFGIFTGDPTDLFDDTGKGMKGPGPIALDYWGWALMNGQNGTQNWSNRFLIAGAIDNDGIIGFGGGSWRTNINGIEEGTGGVAEITLDADNTYQAQISVGLHDADGSADDGGPLYGLPSNPSHLSNLGVDNTDPMSISVVNPFVAVAYIQFIGYLD